MPSTAALVVDDTPLTWADVDTAVSEAADAWRVLGLAPGDRIAIVLGNCPEFVIGYFGALRAGLVAVPLHRDLTAPELAALLGESGARAVLSDRVSSPVLRTLPASAAPAGGTGEPVVRIVVDSAVPGELTFADFLALGRGVRPAGATTGPPDDESVAVVLYTSGTSGSPKGAMLTHRALIASLEQVAALPTPVVSSGDVVLGVLPLSHIYSLNGTLGAVVRAAATLVLVDRATPAQSLRRIREAGVTNVPAVPALWAAWSVLAEFPEAMAGVRLSFNGSDALPDAIGARIHALIGGEVHQGYGLTEAAPGVTTTLASTVARPGSVGRPLPGVELRLVDEAGEEIDPEDGDPGEIWIRGRNLFSGYWPDGHDGPDADGWFATGDVGFVDDDGDLYLVDRRKDLIIVNGFNVYPREIEMALMVHDSVVEAAVVGVPDDESGECVSAYVVLADGASVTSDELAEHCASRLARFKRPATIERVDALPHSLTGKVAKGRLTDRD